MINLGTFIQLGRQQLEPFLIGIDEYIANPGRHPKHGSSQLRAKSSDVYLRHILAVGVLNRLCRLTFLETANRVIVLPDCLKNYGDWTCCKATVDNVSVCTQCHDDCQVFETVERFADDHISVVLEPDDLKRFLQDTISKSGRVGVVGVACALTLLSGFKTTLSLGLPTQGIFLNYASCGHHWADPPYNTSFSFRTMAWVLAKNHGKAAEPLTTGHVGQTYSLIRPPNNPDEFYRRLDDLAGLFEAEFFPLFYLRQPDRDRYDALLDVLQTFAPDLITRDSA